MNEPKVLIVTPIFDEKDYCLEEYLDNITKLDYDNYDWLIIDNSRENWFFEKLQWLSEHYKFTPFKVPRGANSREAINNAMNFARGVMLERDYQYMLVVESDLFPPADSIKRLLSYNKPVVGSYYLIGHKSDNEPYVKALKEGKSGEGLAPQRPCLFIQDRKPNGIMGTRGIRPFEAKDYAGKGLMQIHGCGLGCTLIRRNIIERFPFWTDNRFDNKHHDVYFYMDLQNAGIPVFVDTDVNIPHMPSHWESVSDM